jgi:hypothetical protein
MCLHRLPASVNEPHTLCPSETNGSLQYAAAKAHCYGMPNAKCKMHLSLQQEAEAAAERRLLGSRLTTTLSSQLLVKCTDTGITDNSHSCNKFYNESGLQSMHTPVMSWVGCTTDCCQSVTSQLTSGSYVRGQRLMDMTMPAGCAHTTCSTHSSTVH